MKIKATSLSTVSFQYTHTVISLSHNSSIIPGDDNLLHTHTHTPTPHLYFQWSVLKTDAVFASIVLKSYVGLSVQKSAFS